jgi:hypothetical protein
MSEAVRLYRDRVLTRCGIRRDATPARQDDAWIVYGVFTLLCNNTAINILLPSSSEG